LILKTYYRLSGALILSRFELRKAAKIALLLTILFVSVAMTSFGFESSNVIPSIGSIRYSDPPEADVDVTVNFANVIGTNYFQIGTMPDLEWRTWHDRPVLQQLTKDANFKLIRMFSHRFQPATSWNEATKTGTFDWTNVDSMVETIFEVGAQPEITIMYSYSNDRILGVPSGMTIDSVTKLPKPEQYAAYAKAWVKHFKDKGWSVKYYDLINEAYIYYWHSSSPDYSRLGYYLAVFNAAYDAMHAENSQVIVGSDSGLTKPFLDYWIDHGGKLDMLAFHKYDADTRSWSDSTVFQKAETKYVVTNSLFYGVQDARKKWYDAHGVTLAAINTESNWGAYCSEGTDDRIQQMAGAVWTALMVRGSILSGVDYSIYFTLLSSKSWESGHKTYGWGFGMINMDDNEPWYPYYVNKMIGNNLAVADQIVETTSSTNDVRSLAWLHDGRLMILLINKVNQPRTISIRGLRGQLTFFKIDDTISYETPGVQTGVINPTDLLNTIGYGVILLQTSI